MRISAVCRDAQAQASTPVAADGCCTSNRTCTSAEPCASVLQIIAGARAMVVAELVAEPSVRRQIRGLVMAQMTLFTGLPT